VRPDAVAPATPLYKQYQMWCDDAGEKPETQKMFGMRLRERGYVNAKITCGPHKDRKGWRGIGIKADDTSPKDPDDGGETPPDPPPDGDNGPPSGPSSDNGPLSENSPFAGKASGLCLAADHSGPLNQKVQLGKSRVEKNVEKRSASSASSATLPDEPVRKLLQDSPLWLSTQLAKCREDPARFLKPTSAAIAQAVYATGTRWDEIEPALRRWLEEAR
jgi:hypothetical protein